MGLVNTAHNTHTQKQKMGGCVSKQDEEPEEAHELGRSFGTMFNLHNGVCKIEVNQGTGTAFLCYFTVGEFNRKIHGIVTNNYILPEEDLVNDFTLKFDAYLGGKNVNMQEVIHPQVNTPTHTLRQNIHTLNFVNKIPSSLYKTLHCRTIHSLVSIPTHKIICSFIYNHTLSCTPNNFVF